MAEEISLDLEELRHLQSIAKRPRVVSLISSEIRNLEKLSKENAASTVSQPTTVPLAAQVVSTPALSYITLSSFSWDQDSDKVKIYLSLEGVQEEKVEKTFKPMSLSSREELPIWHTKIEQGDCPREKQVDCEAYKSHCCLAQSIKRNWLDLHYKEDKLKPKLDDKKDPMAGIMDLMKNMYEEGDEEMKRTIAKAWTEARSGRLPIL
ncbi:hypothetical protein Cgig2_029283 [Carnegiea gigantea]|uniref:Calcyclin-binding protein n=1 Tax=Carnegiea gigantea TaxID=171969 RepID=A0A9Q1KS69_9CARY|nr:hypothetical protein Cgig2_029283 [Carnegiea gigantea]